MQKFQDVVLDSQGRPVAGAVIAVQSYPGGTPATVYQTDVVGVAYAPITDSFGAFYFYAPDGRYSYTVTVAGVLRKTVTDIEVVDALLLAQINNPVFTGTVSADSFTFPSTQVPSSGANTLDDYEEALSNSDWTPTDNTGLMSLSGTSGRYVKIGRMVFVDCQFTCAVNADGSTASVGGLPFTAQTGPRTALTIGLSDVGVPLLAYLRSGAIEFTVVSTGAAAVNSLFSGKTIFLSGWMIADA